jgi:ATP synthase protein I
MPGKKGPSEPTRIYHEVGPYLGIGIEFVVAILLCLFLGRWLDGKMGTEPMFMLVGAFVGATAGFVAFIRTVLKLQEKEESSKK